ncbi:helix-turn-helix domain-containing protein [Aquirufa nivalisilvae]
MEIQLEETPNVYDNIKRFRELKNISRQQMADDLDLSLSGYAKLERGEIDITISRINQIASLLGIDVSQLLNFDASQIFNLNNNQLVQGVGTKANTVHYHTDEYLVKYVKVLEQEIERLKSENKNT